jgi:hypothetical protein
MNPWSPSSTTEPKMTADTKTRDKEDAKPSRVNAATALRGLVEHNLDTRHRNIQRQFDLSWWPKGSYRGRKQSRTLQGHEIRSVVGSLRTKYVGMYNATG